MKTTPAFAARTIPNSRSHFASTPMTPTIGTTRKSTSGFVGSPVSQDRPADELCRGRLDAEQGLEVRLLLYVVQTVADFKSLTDLLYKRVRWMTVMRHMRPWGHLGLV